MLVLLAPQTYAPTWQPPNYLVRSLAFLKVLLGRKLHPGRDLFIQKELHGARPRWVCAGGGSGRQAGRQALLTVQWCACLERKRDVSIIPRRSHTMGALCFVCLLVGVSEVMTVVAAEKNLM